MTRLYSIREAAEVLNVPYTWLRDKVTARQVPHTRLGRHVRFTDGASGGDRRRGGAAGDRGGAGVAHGEASAPPGAVSSRISD